MLQLYIFFFCKIETVIFIFIFFSNKRNKMIIKEFNNVKFYIGQSAKENWQLLDDSKRINVNYIWFHLNSFPSPYVIMHSTIDELTNVIDISDSDISIDKFLVYGATQCKEYSKYKFLKDLKIMYVPIKKLKKTEKVGEVIVKGKSKIISAIV